MTVDKHLVVILVGRCKVGSLSVNGAGHVPEVPLCKMHIKGLGSVGFLLVSMRPRRIALQFFFGRIAPYQLRAVIWAFRRVQQVKSEANDLS